MLEWWIFVERYTIYIYILLDGLTYNTRGYFASCVVFFRAIYIYIKNNSLHLARKYARIFVRGHYMFREANSFPRAKLQENCELKGFSEVFIKVLLSVFKAEIMQHCSGHNNDEGIR